MKFIMEPKSFPLKHRMLHGNEKNYIENCVKLGPFIIREMKRMLTDQTQFLVLVMVL